MTPVRFSKSVIFFRKKVKCQTSISPDLKWFKPWFWLRWKEKRLYKIHWFSVRLCHEIPRQGERPPTTPVWGSSDLWSSKSQIVFFLNLAQSLMIFACSSQLSYSKTSEKHEDIIEYLYFLTFWLPLFPYIETSQLICRANHLTGFYMMVTLFVKRLSTDRSTITIVQSTIIK